MPDIAVIGAGGWGTALAVTLANKPGVRVRLFCPREASGRAILAARENKQQLPGVRIPDEVTITLNPEEATAGADGWLVVVPTAFLRTAVTSLRPFARPDVPVVSLTKGIEIDTFRRPTEILSEVLGVRKLCVLSGPSHAEEVAVGKPTGLVAASPDAELALWVQRLVGGERLRVYANSDLIGVELAGALKNVFGIAAGLCDGLGYGDNAKSALVARGLVEMRRFGVTFGANPETFVGLAGVGDLITTCFSTHGRNRKAGERIAQGATLADVLSRPTVAEGVYTAKSVYERVQKAGLDSPVVTAVYRVLYEGCPPREAASELLDRPQKGEHG